MAKYAPPLRVMSGQWMEEMKMEMMEMGDDGRGPVEVEKYRSRSKIAKYL